MATKNKGQIIDGQFQEWYDVDAIHRAELTSEDGQRWKLKVSLDGVLSVEKLIERSGELSHVTSYEEPLVAGEDFVATFVADDGYTLEGATVSVKMGGTDITDTAWNFGAVVIDEVAGDITINISATKINYIIPTADDLTLQLYNGRQAIKAYTGEATAIELPTEIEVDGTTYETSLYYPSIPNTVEHLKCIGIPPAYGGAAAHRPGFSENLKTFWGDGTFDYALKKTVSGQDVSQMERIPIPDKSNFGNWLVSNYFVNVTTIRTARQLLWPQNITNANSLFYGCTNLVDAGTVPEQVTTIKAMFQNTGGKLRRLTVLSKVATGDPYAPAKCVVSMYLDSALFAELRENGTKLNAQPKYRIKSLTAKTPKEILCVGDSLTAGVGAVNDYCYPAYLKKKVSLETIVYNGGQGSTTSAWALERINSGPWNTRKKGATWVVWTGTNGNGNDKTLETVESHYQQIFGSLQKSNLILIPATPAGGGYSRSDHNALIARTEAKFGTNHVFDVLNWFDELGLTRADFMYDSLHYNAIGYSIVAQGIYEKLSANGWIETDYISAEGLTINQSTAILNVGDTLQLSATKAPENATGDVVWHTKNTSVATVDSSGLVTAVAAGEATIWGVVDACPVKCVVTVA